jgi:hypothetical protein
LAFVSFVSSSAFLERFSAILCLNSANRSFFSSSVSGLIYFVWGNEVNRIIMITNTLMTSSVDSSN